MDVSADAGRSLGRALSDTGNLGNDALRVASRTTGIARDVVSHVPIFGNVADVAGNSARSASRVAEEIGSWFG